MVVLSHVLEHISDDKEALVWLHRYLAPKGYVVLMVPNEGATIYKLSHLFSPLAVGKSDHVNFYTEDAIRELLLETGWKLVSIEREQILFPQRLVNLALIANKITYRIMRWLVRYMPKLTSGLQILIRNR